MKIKKFIILNQNDDHAVSSGETEILLNLDHIISIKPIKLIGNNQRIIDGYWIRMSNNKKYRATQIPVEIKELILNSRLSEIEYSFTDTEEQSIQ